MPSDNSSYVRLADAVFALLKGSPPLKSKEIAAHLHRSGWGSPLTNVINKVLTQYLEGRVQRDEAQRWCIVSRS
jgi:hypothetical protein